VQETLNETQNRKVILGGDLNLVLNIEEKFGGSYQGGIQIHPGRLLKQLWNITSYLISHQAMGSTRGITKGWEKAI